MKSDDAAVEFLRYAACRAPRHDTHTNETLALAVLRLRERNPEAGELFASVARRYDVRDAWLGAAVSYHLHGEVFEARSALAQALCRYAHRTIPRLVSDIATEAGADGWATLYSAGRIVVRLLRRIAGGRPPEVSLDNTAVAVRVEASQTFSAQLPTGWRRGRQVQISAEQGEIIGSVIEIKDAVRMEGFADTLHGNLQGWAWCPNDPDYDPVLSVLPPGDAAAIKVTAADHATDVLIEAALAGPRWFEVPAHQLRLFDGPVRIYGENGQELRGSPLDPSIERRSAEALATMVAKLFPAPGCEPELRLGATDARCARLRDR